MLEILGSIGGNILSLPGIVGLALGMMTRHWGKAALLGVVVGVIETALFAGFEFGNILTLELVIAIIVGMVAGCMGCAIRRRGVLQEAM